MTQRDKPPLIVVAVTPRGLRPHTADDAEKLMGLSLGHTFELKPVTKRSDRQLRTYWKALGLAVKATGKWPTAEHLHRDLKFACGFREQFVDWETGEVRERPDSIALDKMSHEEFCEYMNQAMAKLSEAIGFDPLSFLEAA